MISIRCSTFDSLATPGDVAVSPSPTAVVIMLFGSGRQEQLKGEKATQEHRRRWSLGAANKGDWRADVVKVDFRLSERAGQLFFDALEAAPEDHAAEQVGAAGGVTRAVLNARLVLGARKDLRDADHRGAVRKVPVTPRVKHRNPT